MTTYSKPAVYNAILAGKTVKVDHVTDLADDIYDTIFAADGITEDQLESGCVISDKIDADTVGTPEFDTDAVTTNAIKDGEVETAALGTDAFAATAAGRLKMASGFVNLLKTTDGMFQCAYGSYSGANPQADNRSIYVGFRPDWVLVFGCSGGFDKFAIRTKNHPVGACWYYNGWRGDNSGLSWGNAITDFEDTGFVIDRGLNNPNSDNNVWLWLAFKETDE